MLNGFFVFGSEAGQLLYDKVFFAEMDDEKLEMFQSFLIALKTFISGMQFDGSSSIKAINLGDYHVEISHISEISAELVMVVDQQDDKTAGKIIPLINEVILNNKDLFIESERTSEQFQKFDDEVNNVIHSSKKIVDETFLERKSDVFKSIWAQRGELSAGLRKDLIKEKEDLLMNLGSERNLLIRSQTLVKLLDLLEKLNETVNLLSYQKVEKETRDEIKDRRIKLKYYIEKTKQVLKTRNYRDAYLHLYSFSAKLKDMSRPSVQKKYYDLSQILMKKDKISGVEFSKAVSAILIMPNDIDEYLI